jgi:hypothetical protein
MIMDAFTFFTASAYERGRVVVELSPVPGSILDTATCDASTPAVTSRYVRVRSGPTRIHRATGARTDTDAGAGAAPAMDAGAGAAPAMELEQLLSLDAALMNTCSVAVALGADGAVTVWLTGEEERGEEAEAAGSAGSSDAAAVAADPERGKICATQLLHAEATTTAPRLAT